MFLYIYNFVIIDSPKLGRFSHPIAKVVKKLIDIPHLPYLKIDSSSLAVNVIPIDVGSVDSLASLGNTSIGNSSVPGKVLFKSSVSGGTSNTITPEKKDV